MNLSSYSAVPPPPFCRSTRTSRFPLGFLPFTCSGREFLMLLAEVFHSPSFHSSDRVKAWEGTSELTCENHSLASFVLPNLLTEKQLSCCRSSAKIYSRIWRITASVTCSLTSHLSTHPAARPTSTVWRTSAHRTTASEFVTAVGWLRHPSFRHPEAHPASVNFVLIYYSVLVSVFIFYVATLC